MKLQKENLLLYAITDRDCIGDRDFYREIENALAGGVTILQLREKNSDTESLIAEAAKVKEICKKYNVPLIINDDVEAAIKSGADGVHVGAKDMAVAEIRKKAGADFIIGATAKTVEQAKTAEARGADYLGVGAVFPSPTKRNAVRITAEQLKEISSAVSIPVVAIGGLTYNNIDIIENSGVSGAAVISAVFGVQDVKTAAEKLKEKLRNLLNTYLV